MSVRVDRVKQETGGNERTSAGLASSGQSIPFFAKYSFIVAPCSPSSPR